MRKYATKECFSSEKVLGKQQVQDNYWDLIPLLCHKKPKKQTIAAFPDPGLSSATQLAHTVHSPSRMESAKSFKVQSFTGLEHFPLSP